MSAKKNHQSLVKNGQSPLNDSFGGYLYNGVPRSGGGRTA